MELGVKLPVLINFSSEIHDGDEKTSFSFQTSGQYYIKEGKNYLLFHEKREDQEDVKTTVKWSEREALIKRSGSVNMRIPFQLHEKTKGIHETPEVKLEMTALTDKIVHSWDRHTHKGKFKLSYTLTMQGTKVGTYHIEIKFEEE